MVFFKRLGVCASVLALTGCASFSFSPPNVTLDKKTVATSSGYHVQCMPVVAVGNAAAPIDPTVKGAQALIDNFIYVYRCSEHQAANGRQLFEIPSLLGQIGVATALAFGAPGGYAIGGGAATGTLAAGNKYYAPQKKAEIFDHALDALLCIKTEALGVDPFTVDAISKVEAAADPGRALLLGGGGTGVSVTAEQQYFGLIQASLLSVERVVAQRLNNAGAFDAAGVIAQVEKIAADIKAKKDAATTTAPAKTASLVAAANQNKAMAMVPFTTMMAAQPAKISETIVAIDTLEPKLQQCVMRAKI